MAVPLLRRLLAALLALLALTAHADTVESVLSPGPVIEGHAKLEGDCKNCHVRFKKSAQQGLCMDCHEDVAKDVARHMGFHGRLEKKQQDCRRCHTDHKGRHVDITGLDPNRFDHKLTDSDDFFIRFTISDGNFSETNESSIWEIEEENLNQYWTVEEKHVFSPSLLNEFRFAYNRSSSRTDEFGPVD